MSTLPLMLVPDAPQNLIGDNAYDSHRLDAELRFYSREYIEISTAVDSNRAVVGLF